MLYECVYPCFTYLRICGNWLTINLNTHPELERISLSIDGVELVSTPYVNHQRVHVRLDVLKRFEKQFKTLS